MASALLLNNIIAEFGLSTNGFEQKIGAGMGAIRKLIDRSGGISDNLIEKIVRTYPDINRIWLETGEGYMFDQSFGGAIFGRVTQAEYDAMPAGKRIQREQYAERFEKFMLHLGATSVRKMSLIIADAMGLDNWPEANVERVFKGLEALTTDVLQALKAKHNLNLDWLNFNEGKMIEAKPYPADDKGSSVEEETSAVVISKSSYDKMLALLVQAAADSAVAAKESATATNRALGMVEARGNSAAIEDDEQQTLTRELSNLDRLLAGTLKLIADQKGQSFEEVEAKAYIVGGEILKSYSNDKNSEKSNAHN